MQCRVCGCEIHEFEEIRNVEVEVNSLYKRYVQTSKADIKFYRCPECTHMQTENILSEQHYENYNLMNLDGIGVDNGGNAVIRSKYYQSVLKELYKLGGQKGKLLDIGCGHGTILKIAETVFEDCLGIEPSEVESEIARKKGCKVVNAFFDESFQQREFSAFISTQVFEHLPDPVATMKMAATILKQDGVGYIDVPNGQSIYKENRYFDINVEHINYYTIESLTRLIEKSGLEIISIGEILNGFHIGAYVRKKARRISFMEEKNADIRSLANYIEKYNNVALWGAGIKGRTYVQLIKAMDAEKICYIFDSNKAISGYYIGNCNIPVEYPEQEKVERCDLIIVTALEYYYDIKRMLETDLKFKGKILSIEEMRNNGL